MPKVHKTNMETIEKKLASIGSGLFFKAKEGLNIVRILPPWNDQGDPFYEATLHYGLKMEGKMVTVPGPHPIIMKEIEKLEKAGREDSKLAKRLAPRIKFYANILDRKTGKVSIWGFSRKILKTILGYMGDPDYGDITDPDRGHDLVIDREGSGMNDTRYEVRIKPKPSELGDEVDLDKLPKLDEVIGEEISDDDVEEMLEAAIGSGGDGEEDEAPRKKKVVEEEEEEDEDPEDDKAAARRKERRLRRKKEAEQGSKKKVTKTRRSR